MTAGLVRVVGVWGLILGTTTLLSACGAAAAGPDPATDASIDAATDPTPADVPVPGDAPPDQGAGQTADLVLDTRSNDAGDTDAPGPPEPGTSDGPRDIAAAETAGVPDAATDAQTGPSPLDGPGIFVAVGYGGRRVRSVDDGLTWIDDTSITPNGGDDTNLLRTVGWGSGQFVALGFRVITSPNGRDWLDHGTTIGQWLGAVVYAQGQYVAVGGYGLRGTSTDGVTWVHHDVDTVATHSDGGHGLIVAADRGGRFVSANDDGRRSHSTDGKTWMFGTGAGTTRTAELAAGNGVVVGLGGTAVVVSSDGGVTWVDAPPLGSAVTSVVFAQGHFTAMGAGHVFTSTDGTTWTDRPVAGLAAGGLAYGHGTYISWAGPRLRRSTDGATWAPAVVLTGTNSITCVVFGPSP